MGNRAVITTPKREIGLYLHWNGGRDTIEPLLKYCELKGYRPPSSDCYGWARICQVMGNFLGGALSLGIGAYSTDENMNPGDNGIYVIEGWRIVERVYPYESFSEQAAYDFDEMLRSLDASMPEGERLGDFLDAREVPASELKIGDAVWMPSYESGYELFPVAGFADDGTPLVARFDHDGDWSWNPNNRVREETVRVAAPA
ncbi:hypothetical protein [Enteroscipio rubneri]|uniref:hypothetical protein n=1 Tax=Enteroscipio rubneri TaxID=2070686 RepID=UPI00320B9F1B